jgi:hypothetical protein
VKVRPTWFDAACETVPKLRFCFCVTAGVPETVGSVIVVLVVLQLAPDV